MMTEIRYKVNLVQLRKATQQYDEQEQIGQAEGRRDW